MVDPKDVESSGISKETTASRLKNEVQRRTISPYDFSPSDNPGSVISQPLLKGMNYNEWASNLRTSLKARKKFWFVDGTIPCPSVDDSDFEDWCTNNALVLSWIKLTITDDVRSTLSQLEYASELWDHVKMRYSVKNGQRVQRLKAELATCRQHGMSIELYYAKLNQLWTSLSEFRVSKSCGCPIGIELQREREEDRLHEFLKGLDESVYGTVKSNLLSRDPLPKLEEAYSALLQDEDSRRTSRVMDEKESGLYGFCDSSKFSAGSWFTVT